MWLKTLWLKCFLVQKLVEIWNTYSWTSFHSKLSVFIFLALRLWNTHFLKYIFTCDINICQSWNPTLLLIHLNSKELTSVLINPKAMSMTKEVSLTLLSAMAAYSSIYKFLWRCGWIPLADCKCWFQCPHQPLIYPQGPTPANLLNTNLGNCSYS